MKKNKNFWGRIKLIKKESIGNFCIAIGSIFIFGAWIAHDLFEANYQDKKGVALYNETFLKLNEFGANSLTIFRTFLDKDSSKQNLDSK